MLQHVFMLFILNLLLLESFASKQRIIGGKNIPPRKIWQQLQLNYCYFSIKFLLQILNLTLCPSRTKMGKKQKWCVINHSKNYFSMTFRHSCGGSIIGNSTFITAAHCFYDHSKRQIPSNEFLIVSGTYNQVFFNEESI